MDSPPKEMLIKEFETILERTQDGYIVTNKQKKIIQVNSTYCNLIGYTEEELLCMHLSDIEIVDTPEKIRNHTKKITQGKHDLFETTHRRKDGSLLEFEASVTYLETDEGKFISFLRDITAKKKFFQTLKRHEENLNQAQKLAEIGHWELDLVNNELYWSDEVYRIFGLQPQEFDATYEAFLDHIHSDDHDLVNYAYTNSIAKKSSYRVKHRVKTKQGDLKYVEERCSHELDNDGNVIRSIGTVHDITKTIQNEKELTLASNVFKYSTDAIIITDKNNKIISVNKAFEMLTGYIESEIVGKNPRVISSGWGNKDFYKQMWNSIIKNGIWRGEIWDRKKNGDLYAVSESIIAVKDNDDQIINFIGISHDITQTKENEERIKQLAYYDFLTNLPNRKLFEQEVNSFIKSSHFNQKKFAILFLDLDNFKWVNDSLGHHFGDKVLSYVSDLIQPLIREDSILARLGGDEFVILIPYEELLNVSQLSTELIEQFKDTIVLERQEINIGCSIGISLFPENGTTYEVLLQNADTAMYKAKDEGKNNFKYFTEYMNTTAKKRLELDTRLRNAVTREEFYLVYQPKISSNNQNTIGFEALIRWNDTKLGFIPPDEFIPVAEQSGYIYEIGLWVLKRAFIDINTINKHYNNYTMAINISGKQIEDVNFLADIESLIHEYSIDASKIEFEITETAVMHNIQNIIPTLQKIKELGIKLSIDDFGTGYSSMAYLKKMPLDVLKIDREFISNLEHDGEDKAIVEATIALAKALKLKTVAEGVETQEHTNILKDLECDAYQGYFYSKPLKLEELFDYLK